MTSRGILRSLHPCTHSPRVCVVLAQYTVEIYVIPLAVCILIKRNVFAMCVMWYVRVNTPTPRYVRANDKIRQIHSGHFYLKPTRENSNGGYKTCMENVARRLRYIFDSWVHEHWTEEKSEWKKGHKRLLIPQNSTYLTSPLRTERIRNGLYVGIEVL